MKQPRADRWQEVVRQLLEVRRPEQAEQVVRRQLAAHPQDASAYEQLGLVLLNQKHRNAEALAAIQQALALDPQNSDAHYFHSVALLRAGQSHAALQSIGEALCLHVYSATYWGYKALILNALGRPADAQTAARTGLNSAPTHAECLVQVAQAQQAQQQWQVLNSTLQQLVKAHPQLPLAHRLLGQEALRQERFSVAQTHYEDVLRLTPNDVEAHRSLTSALRYQFGPGRLMRRLDLYMTFISEGTKRRELRAWGHFLLILIPLSLLCIPVLLFVGFEGLYWRLHPQIRQLRNRPAAAPSYFKESLYRYGTVVSYSLLLLSLLPPLIWVFIIQLEFPESSLGSGLTGGLTVLVIAIGKALKDASDMPLPEKSPVGWLLVASLCLAASITSAFWSVLWPWGPFGLLLVSGLLFYWRLRTAQQDLPSSTSH